MRTVHIVVAALLCAALAGCFTADKPLLTDANSVAPYAKITFHEQSNSDLTTLTRDAAGRSYAVMDKSGGPTTFRFMAADRANWYVAEVSGGADPTGVQRLYAVIRVDLANHRADAFKTVADAKDVAPGLRMCEHEAICIDDLKAYIASAEKYADSGAAPDAVYEITIQ